MTFPASKSHELGTRLWPAAGMLKLQGLEQPVPSGGAGHGVGSGAAAAPSRRGPGPERPGWAGPGWAPPAARSPRGRTDVRRSVPAARLLSGGGGSLGREAASKHKQLFQRQGGSPKSLISELQEEGRQAHPRAGEAERQRAEAGAGVAPRPQVLPSRGTPRRRPARGCTSRPGQQEEGRGSESGGCLCEPRDGIAPGAAQRTAPRRRRSGARLPRQGRPSGPALRRGGGAAHAGGRRASLRSGDGRCGGARRGTEGSRGGGTGRGSRPESPAPARASAAAAARGGRCGAGGGRRRCEKEEAQRPACQSGGASDGGCRRGGGPARPASPRLARRLLPPPCPLRRPPAAAATAARFSRRDFAGASASSATASSHSVPASAPSRAPGNLARHRLLVVAGGRCRGARTGAAHLRARG